MKTKPWLGRISLMLAVALIPATACAGSVADVFSEFDRGMATFDPIGQHVRAPLERALPRLRIKGFLRQWSDVLIDQHGEVGFRDQDFRFLQLQNMLELETAYHVATGLDVNAVTHFLYDGVYDWQDSDGLFADSIDRSAELYHDSERILRELYISYRRPTFDLMVGKQQVAWGKMDGQFIDIVNGMDRRESVQLETEDYEWRRLPTWMANATFHFGRSSVQLLYVFDFEEDRNPLPGSPWASPQIPPSGPGSDVYLPAVRPEADNFDDHQYGMRIDRQVGGLTYGFVYFYAWDKNPVERIVGTQAFGASTLLHLEPRHERLHHAGVTADYAATVQDVPLIGTLPVVFRVEGLYSNGVRFVDYDKQALARFGVTTDGTAKRDTVRAAVAAEFGLPARSTFILQASYFHTLGWSSSLGPGFGGGFGDEWTMIPVAYFSRPFAFTRDRLNMELTFFPIVTGPDRGWQGLKTKLRLAYKVSPFVRAQFIYNGYDGGADTDTYGQYNQWDNFGWELSYEF
jgi:hypothetical protein